MNKRHIHAEVIKAWADGFTIRSRQKSQGKIGLWQIDENPTWDPDMEYSVGLKVVRVPFDGLFSMNREATNKVFGLEDVWFSSSVKFVVSVNPVTGEVQDLRMENPNV